MSGGVSYGPGDWRPQPRSASDVYGGRDHTNDYQTTYYGHSAPVTPQIMQPGLHDKTTSPYATRESWTLETPRPLVGPYSTPGPVSAPLYGHGQSTPLGISRNLSPIPGRLTYSNSGYSVQRSHSQGKDRSRSKQGPPPKAVLGGVGGKTWDELQLTDRSVSTPLPLQLPSSSNPTTDPPRCQSHHGMVEVVMNLESEPMFKGNPIVFRPPLPTYSPPESPERHQPSVPDPDIDVKEERQVQVEISPGSQQPKVPRKEAFPWPARRPRGAPETIPLPLSPSDTTMKGRRRRMVTGVSRDIVRDGGGNGDANGETVAVFVPDPVSVKIYCRYETDGQTSWDRLKAEARERRRSTLALDTESNLSQPGLPSHRARVSDTISGKTEASDTQHPSSHCRTLSSQEHSRDRTASGSSLALSPPSSRRGTGMRFGDNAFIRRQLGGMMKERTRSSDEVIQSAGIVETTSSMAAEIENSQKRDGDAVNDDQDHIEESTMREDVGQESKPDLTSLQQARQRVEESVRARQVTSPGHSAGGAEKRTISRDDHTDKVSYGAELLGNMNADIELHTTVDMLPDPTRKRKMKLANFDGFLGRQLGGSGLLGPKSKNVEEAPTLSNAEGVEIEQMTNSDHDCSSGEVPVNGDVGNVEDGSKKRTRPASDDGPPSKLGSAPSVTNTGSLSKLRPTASIFRPHPPLAAAFDLVPPGQTSFNFSGDLSAPTTLRPAAAVFKPRKSISLAIEEAVLKDRRPSVYRDAVTDVTTPPLSSDSSTHEDIPASLDGGPQSESTAIVEPRIPVVVGSPAAELHGIFDTSPNDSISDGDLFYRPPRSEVSEEPSEDLESFDPVSYSYDHPEDDIPNAPDLRSSTPHRDWHSIEGGGNHDRTSSPESQTVGSPTINVAPPSQAGDDKRRFREWTFPRSDHDHRPSISRRHTFDNQRDGNEDGRSHTQNGVASTFASRVGDLRAFLAQSIKGEHLRVSSAHDHLTSSRSSVEFPIRSPAKVLAVVNDVFADDPEATPRSGAIRPTNSVKSQDLLRGAMDKLQATMERMMSTRDERGERTTLSRLEVILELMTQRLDGMCRSDRVARRPC